MKKTHSMVLSSLVLSGAVLVMAPQALSQTGGSSGSGSTQKSDPSARGSSTERGTAGSSSSDMQTQREPGSSPQRSARAGHMSKENVKQVQAALKSKGMDPGPEDGVMGPKTQAALREFQKSNNLQVTGRLDDKTASALGVESGSGMGSSSGRSTSQSPSSGRESSSGTGTSSSGSSPTDAKSGASQSPSGTQGGTTASPSSKPTGKE